MGRWSCVCLFFALTSAPAHSQTKADLQAQHDQTCAAPATPLAAIACATQQILISKMKDDPPANDDPSREDESAVSASGSSHLSAADKYNWSASETARNRDEMVYALIADLSSCKALATDPSDRLSCDRRVEAIKTRKEAYFSAHLSAPPKYSPYVSKPPPKSRAVKQPSYAGANTPSTSGYSRGSGGGYMKAPQVAAGTQGTSQPVDAAGNPCASAHEARRDSSVIFFTIQNACSFKIKVRYSFNDGNYRPGKPNNVAYLNPRAKTEDWCSRSSGCTHIIELAAEWDN